MKVLFARCAVVCFALLAASVLHASSVTYRVSNLPSLGGASSGISINNRDWVSGSSNLAGDAIMHAALWRNGSILDLQTLGGDHSAVLWPVKNNSGLIVGVTETAEMNPYNEIWSCGRFFPTATRRVCVGFVWADGAMRLLKTLGGPNGFAAGANNQGQVVGWAENTIEDPQCVDTQVLQFHAVVWDRNGEIRPLPPYPGDSAGAATAINDHGQIVGISGICDRAFGRFSARHAVLWENGTPIDLGDLGGVAWNTPTAINDRGEIVGFANVPGGPTPGSFFAHAFIKTPADDAMRELPMLPDHVYSQALGINNRGQIVGMSCTAGFAVCHAVLWENGEIKDLDDLAPEYDGELVFANDINDAGEITGGAFVAATNESPAFVAVPQHEGNVSVMRAKREATVLPASVREKVMRQLRITP